MSQSAWPVRADRISASRVPLDTIVALVVVALMPLRIRTMFEIPLAVVVCAVLLPVTLRHLSRYIGAWAIVSLTLAAALSGWALTVLSGAVRDVSNALLIAQSARVLGIGVLLAALLWARSLAGTRQVILAFGVGTLVNVALSGVNGANPWKFSFSIPITLVLLSLPLVYGRKLPQFLVVVALAGVSAVSDSRSAAGFLLIAAAITLTQSRGAAGTSIALRRWLTLVRVVVLALAAFVLLQAAILEGMLGEGIQERTQAQIDRSGSVFAGGRPELGASVALLRAEPAGYGSGAVLSGTDVRVAKQGMWSLGYDPNNGYVENYMFGDGIELHSLFADIWVMFGVGGIALALAIIVFTMRGVLHDIATGVASTVAMYLALRLLWDMAFSPWLSSLVLLPLAVGASLTDRVVARQQQETAGRR